MGSTIGLHFTCLIICLLLNESQQFYDDDDDLVVTLANPVSKIHGHILQSANGMDYYAFQEIPYAQPPVGENRFQPPKLAVPWDDTLEVTNNTKMCPQQHYAHTDNITIIDNLLQTEDCLFLNVYSPVRPGSNTSLPVFFWIHGGAFLLGHGGISSYNPGSLIDYDVVIVTLNYRLGVLGFLTTNDEYLPGNLGLKDQRFALKWTHDNIHLFGGDAQKITLGGESAGGMSVGAQLLSQLNKGLFKGVIQQSGSAFSTFECQPYYRELAFRFGKSVDESFDSNKPSDLLKLLQRASLNDLRDAQLQIDETTGFMPSMIWKPIIEDEFNRNALISGPMYNDVITGNFNLVPILIGFNSEESLAFLDGVTEEQYVEITKRYDGDDRLLISEQINVAEENRETVGKKLKALYTSTSFLENKTAFVRYTSDEVFTRSTIKQADTASRYVPVYLYQLSANSNPGEIPGVQHAVDLSYLWGIQSDNLVEALRKPILKLWTNFIKTQNPTPVIDEDIQSIIWSAVKPHSVRYLNLNEVLEMLENPRQYQEISEILDKVIEPPYNVY